MAQKTMPAHRDYSDAEPSYDGPDQGYDTIDADPDGGDQVDGETGFPAPDVFPAHSVDAFPNSLFDDELKRQPKAKGPGHGDS